MVGLLSVRARSVAEISRAFTAHADEPAVIGTVSYVAQDETALRAEAAIKGVPVPSSVQGYRPQSQPFDAMRHPISIDIPVRPAEKGEVGVIPANRLAIVHLLPPLMRRTHPLALVEVPVVTTEGSTTIVGAAVKIENPSDKMLSNDLQFAEAAVAHAAMQVLNNDHDPVALREATGLQKAWEVNTLDN